MSEGQVLWYRARSDRRTFQRLVSAFAESGISLTHPATGRAVLLNVDGDQVRMSAEEVVNLVGTSLCALNIQFWYSTDTDLVCCVSYRPFGWEKHTYYLDGLDVGEVDRCLAALYDQVSRHPTETIALVVDRTGRTADVDWDELMSSDRFELTERPDVLILNRTMIGGFSGPFCTPEEFAPDLEVVIGSVSRKP